MLDTLAAAHAAAGRFPDAISAAHEGEKAAKLSGDEISADSVTKRRVTELLQLIHEDM